MIAVWFATTWLILSAVFFFLLRPIVAHRPTRNHPKELPFRNPRVSADDAHRACLAETNRLERELGMLSALSESEFDREVERAIRPHNPVIPNVNAMLGPITMAESPCCEEHSEQWWREKAWEIWRNNRRY